MVRTEFKRAFSSKFFWWACGIMLAMLAYGSSAAIYQWRMGINDHPWWTIYLGARYPAVSDFYPVVVVMPYVLSYRRDRDSGYRRLILLKSTRKAYLRAKVLAVAGSAFAAVLLSNLCWILASMLLGTADPAYDRLRQNIYFAGSLYDQQPGLYCVIYAVHASLLGTAFALLGLGLSAVVKNRYLAVLLPYCYFVISTVFGGFIGKSFAAYDLLQLQGYHRTDTYPLGYWTIPLYEMMLTLVGFVLFLAGEHHYEPFFYHCRKFEKNFQCRTWWPGIKRQILIGRPKDGCEMKKSESMVELNHVKKAYESKVLFTDLNLKVQRGENCAIAGANGSGKSVLFKMICGLVRPDEGEVIVGGERIEKGKFPQNIGVMLDTVGFLPNETGLKNLAVIAGIRRKATRGEVEDAMRLAGLNPASRVKVGGYSPEMRQRLAIAQALMERPSLLILDEPFDGIDRHMVRDFRQLLERLNTQEGVTILMTFHRLKDIQDLCGSVYQIDEGSLKKLEAQEVVLQSLIENIKE